MRRKIRLGVLFGGRSCEHEVSVTSARSMLAAIDPDKYEVTLIGITKDGQWLLADAALARLPGRVVEGDDLVPVFLDYPAGRSLVKRLPVLPGAPVAPTAAAQGLDIIFPLLHGPFGEDGTVQGLLELADMPYVGSGVVGSAVGMDKAMMKRAFRAEGIPMLDYRVLASERYESDPEGSRRQVEEALGYPLFVKPASLGSSVGVHRIDAAHAFAEAAADAAQYDEKIIFERAALDCREIECAVLGNDTPQASVLGEIVPADGFYDYDAKYVEDTAELIVPADLPPELTERVRGLAVAAFEAVDAQGLARVDFFVSRDGTRVYLNEINTMPGFTPISMYPRLWEASGIPYPELIDRLVGLGLERHARRRRIRAAL